MVRASIYERLEISQALHQLARVDRESDGLRRQLDQVKRVRPDGRPGDAEQSQSPCNLHGRKPRARWQVFAGVDLGGDNVAYLGAILSVTQGAMVADSVKGAVRRGQIAAAATTLPDYVTMVTIHRRRPRGYWVRVWMKRGGTSLPRQTHHRTSLKTSRAMVPAGMSCSPRSERDADDLVEVWNT